MKLSNNRMTNKKAEMMMMMMNPTNPKPTSATLCSAQLVENTDDYNNY